MTVPEVESSVGASSRPGPLRRARRVPWREYAAATGVVLVATAACLLVRNRVKTIDVAMLYLLAVVLVASRFRRGPSLLASALSIALFDVGFVAPYGTFDVHDTAYLFTFAMMLVVAVVMSRLTARIREQAEASALRERRTAALYELGRELAGAGGRDQVARVAERHLANASGAGAVVVLAVGGDDLQLPALPVFVEARHRDAAAWVFAHDLPAGSGTDSYPELDILLLPVSSPMRHHGIAAVGGPVTGGGERRALEVIAHQAGLALERLLLAERHEHARVAMEAERLRTTLLSSLSHDLRTPLASIEGAATTILNASGLAPGARQELAETIVEESRRMTRLVANLLDMVRLETGTLAVQKAWMPVEELVGVALLRLEAGLAAHPVEVSLPADLPLVPVDEVLMEQVLVNLLENEARYTPPGTPIGVTAWSEGDAVVLEVADRGPGVPAGEEEAVFRKFYRAGPVRGEGAGVGDRSATGAGLGLTICRGIVTAHGGRIWVQPRSGGGAAFRVVLPLDAPQPLPPPVEADPAGVLD